MYVNGRYMRPANLADMENASCWDAETVKVLMGSGCLYVLRGAVHVSPEEPEDDVNAEEGIKKEEHDSEVQCYISIYVMLSAKGYNK